MKAKTGNRVEAVTSERIFILDRCIHSLEAVLHHLISLFQTRVI